MQFNPLNMNQPYAYTKSNIIIPTIPTIPPLNINYITNEKHNDTNSSHSSRLSRSPDTLSLNANNSINTNENMNSLTLNAIEQEIQNGIKQYIHSDISNVNRKIQKADNNKLFNFKKRRKIKKNGFHKLSVKYINKSLHSLHKEINPQKQLLNQYNLSVSKLKGPLNGYVQYSNSKPMNLKMIRDTRNNRNIQQSLKQIKNIKHCTIGDKIVIINKLHRENKEITQYQTDIMQIKGVISDVFSDYINVIIPIDFERKQFIQRKIYAFDMKNEEYGAVYTLYKPPK
eukprot:143007_1